MPTEFRAVVNLKGNASMNVSFQATAFLETQEEAEEFGDQMRSLADGWIDGYGKRDEPA